jgi:hypothetical protein
MRMPILCLVLWCVVGSAMAQGVTPPAFRYQGLLRQNDVPVNGTRNLAFALFDRASGGTQRGDTVMAPDWPIADGLLAIDLAFPDALQGEQRWLEVRVEGVPMLPRQPVIPAPVARRALAGNIGPAGPPGPRGPTGPQGTTAQVPYTNCGRGNAVQAVRNSGEVVCITDALNNWSRVSTDFELDTLFIITASVQCSADQVVLGGGIEQLQRDAEGRPANRELQVIESLPTFRDGRWMWQVSLGNRGPRSQLRLFATCART